MLALWLEPEGTTRLLSSFHQRTHSLSQPSRTGTHTRSFSLRLIFSSDPGPSIYPRAVGLFWSWIPQGNVSLSSASNPSDHSHQRRLCQRATTGKAQKNVLTCGTEQQRKEMVACQSVQPLHLCRLQMHLIFQPLLPWWLRFCKQHLPDGFNPLF